MPLSSVDIPMSRAYADARRVGKIGGGKSQPDKTGRDSTIRREIGVLLAAANHARKWKRILPTDMPSIELTKISAGAAEDDFGGEAKFFSREQIALLIFNAHGVTRDIIKLCYYTAARRRSIEKLTVRQIDFARQKINLATPGKKQTKKRQPIVPLFDVIAPDLRRLVEGKKPTDQLFGNMRFYLNFVMTCEALGFEAPFHPHMLRHSRATHLLQDGKKIYSVAALLGDTMQTVEANYGHHSPGELKGDLE